MTFFPKVYGSWSGIQEEKYRKILEISKLAKFDFSKPALDLGCGPFFFERFLERNNINTKKIICIDVGRQEQKEMKERNFALAHGEKMPFADNSFSFLICIDTIHLLSSTSELSRVLKPGGMVLATQFFNSQNQQEVEESLAKKLNKFKILSKTIFKGRENEIIVIAKKPDGKKKTKRR